MAQKRVGTTVSHGTLIRQRETWLEPALLLNTEYKIADLRYELNGVYTKSSTLLSSFFKFLTTLIASRIIQAENASRSIDNTLNTQFPDFI